MGYTVRKVDNQDVREAWSSIAQCHLEMISLFVNALVAILLGFYLESILVYHVNVLYAITAIMGLMVLNSWHDEAQTIGLKQIKDAFVKLAQIERQIFDKARGERNTLAVEFNLLQQEIDNHKGLFYRLTSFWRQEIIKTDFSLIESATINIGSFLGTQFQSHVAPMVVKSRGYGVCIFLCLPKGVKENPKILFGDVDQSVYGVYFLGTLMTRFNIVSLMLKLFPKTIESERIVSMRMDAIRIQNMIWRKTNELNVLMHTLKLVDQ